MLTTSAGNYFKDKSTPAEISGEACQTIGCVIMNDQSMKGIAQPQVTEYLAFKRGVAIAAQAMRRLAKQSALGGRLMANFAHPGIRQGIRKQHLGPAV